MPWRRERLPTPVFWPGEFHGLCSPRGHKEDTTAQLSLHFTTYVEKLSQRGFELSQVGTFSKFVCMRAQLPSCVQFSVT